MIKVTSALPALALLAANAGIAGELAQLPVSPVSIATPVSWSAGLELGFGGSARTSTDTTIENSPFYGGSIGGYFSTELGQLNLTIDGHFTQYNMFGVTDAYVRGPKGSGAVGVHLGKDFGNTFIGGFAAYGVFDGYHALDYMGGGLAGVEASRRVGPGTAFAQVGYTSLIGDPNDNELVGIISRVGYSFDIGERIGVLLEAEYGSSGDCFVDCGNQPGEYWSTGVTLDYQLSDRLSAYVQYQYLHIHDFDDPDTGVESNIMAGVSMSFGAGKDNLLSTPMGAYQAAGWMRPLD